MDIKAYGETAEAVFFSATFEDFKAKSEDTKIREWQEAYFELMSLQNTYRAFHDMRIVDYRVSPTPHTTGYYSVKFYLVANKGYARSIREWLKERFCEVFEEDWTIALVSTIDITDLKGKELDDITAVYEG